MFPKVLSPGTAACRRLVVRCLALAACALVLIPACSNAQSADARVTLETRTNAFLAGAVDAGPLPASQRLTLTLTFATTPERSAALDQFLIDLTTDSSPSYRKWITPAQFAARFGATADQIAAATAWAQAQGLTIESISPSGARITISGFTQQVQNSFAVSLQSYKAGGAAYFANADQPSLPAATAALFSGIDGLDDLPVNSALTLKGAPTTFSALAAIVDANSTPLLNLVSGLCSTAISPSQLAQYTALFQQAVAQGITTLATRTCSAGGFPSALAEVTAVALPGDVAETAAPITARPDWQSAPGLPADTFRHAPDLTAPSANALAQTLASIATSITGNRLGNINPVLYQLAPTPGLFDQKGTWAASTGLGLVDLDKLAKAFPRGTGSSFVSLAVSPTYSPIYGTTLTFTSSVTSGTGGPIPTGTVSDITTSGTVVCGPVAEDANGNTTCSTSTLAPGSYQIVASYSGDATYAGSQSSPPAGITVQAPTATFSGVVSTGNIVGGTFTVTVTATVPSGAPQPTGNITLNISGTNSSWTQALVPVTANTSAATFTEPASTVGTLTLAATCSGSSNFSCPNQLTTTVTIAKANPGLSISYTPNPPVSGATINLSAQLTAYGTAPIPSGTVTFFDNGIGLNSANINSSGVASTTGVAPTASTHNITAVYNGDANYNTVTASGSSPSNPVATVALTTSNVSPAAGASVTFTATVAGPAGAATPQGSVTFTDSVSGPLGQGSLTGGVATLSTTALPSGSSTVTASYNGSNSYNPGSSNPVTENVGSGATVATTLSVSATSGVTLGQTFSVTALVTGASAAGSFYPTGTVTITASGAGYSGSTAVGVTSGGGNTASGTVSIVAATAGTVTFTATYSGDSHYAASGPSTTTVTIPKATPVTTLSASTPTAGGATTLTATVQNVGPTLPTGTVAFTSGGTTLGTANVGSNETATLTYTFTSGNHVVTAVYSGDSNYNSSTSNSVNTVTGTVATTTSISSNTYAITAGQNFTLTAAVTPSSTVNGTAPTGSVLFTNASTGAVLGSAPLGANGMASYTPATPLTAGSYTFTATYSGDSNYAASVSAASSPVVISAAAVASLSATISPGSIGTNGSATVLATVTLPGSTVPPTGSVTVTVLGVSGAVYRGTLTSSGGNVATASIAVPAPPAGTYTVQVACSAGDSFTCTPVTLQLVSTSASNGTVPSSIALTASSTTGTAGSNITFTAVVSGTVSGGTSPTGTVSFYLNGTPAQLLGTAQLSPNGTGSAIATFNTSSIPAGTQSVYAVYSGDSIFAPSTSAPISIGLSDYSITFTPPNITLTPGETGTVTLNVIATAGFNGTILLGCTPPTNTLITCSLSTNALAGSGTDTLTIKTTANKAENHVPGFTTGFKAAGGVAFAAMLGLLLPGVRRRRLPALLLSLLALGITTTLVGCASTVSVTPVGGGTPLGTVNLTIFSAASVNGASVVNHDYTYQVTIIQ